MKLTDLFYVSLRPACTRIQHTVQFDRKSDSGKARQEGDEMAV